MDIRRQTEIAVAIIAVTLVTACGHTTAGGASNLSPGTVAVPSATTTASAIPKSVLELNGTYRWTLTKSDARAHGTVDDKTAAGLANYPKTYTVVLSQNVWTMTETGDADSGTGPYTVDGKKITLIWPREGSANTFTFAVNAKGDLRLTAVLPMDLGDAFVTTTEPWIKIH